MCVLSTCAGAQVRVKQSSLSEGGFGPCSGTLEKAGASIMKQGFLLLVREVCQLWCFMCDFMLILKACFLAVITKWVEVQVCFWAQNTASDQISNLLPALTGCEERGGIFSSPLVQSPAGMNKIIIKIFGSSLSGPHCWCTSNVLERVTYFLWSLNMQR